MSIQKDHEKKCKHHKECKPHHCEEKEVKVKKHFEKDCIFTEWKVPKGKTQIIFQTSGFEHLVGSGFVSYEEGESPFVFVRFFKNGFQVGSEIKVFKDSCVAFTYTKFDTITVTCPYENETETKGDNSFMDCEGEIKIHSRFPID